MHERVKVLRPKSCRLPDLSHPLRPCHGVILQLIIRHFTSEIIAGYSYGVDVYAVKAAHCLRHVQNL